ncbi:hypothetical protein EJ06DRAFT_555240 [Trichodelitschia bisporula]|uniref:Uncharacterized protein n=1 Tax=Trichodelitschia bisporula TaxID=703511 RepID=A0A6G1I2W6_9PEZI|nr:hypothetical protein EJ06DRAFT_555240 [Trichodelitschia bisporula]
MSDSFLRCNPNFPSGWEHLQNRRRLPENLEPRDENRRKKEADFELERRAYHKVLERKRREARSDEGQRLGLDWQMIWERWEQEQRENQLRREQKRREEEVKIQQQKDEIRLWWENYHRKEDLEMGKYNPRPRVDSAGRAEIPRLTDPLKMFSDSEPFDAPLHCEACRAPLDPNVVIFACLHRVHYRCRIPMTSNYEPYGFDIGKCPLCPTINTSKDNPPRDDPPHDNPPRDDPPQDDPPQDDPPHEEPPHEMQQTKKKKLRDLYQ